MSRSFHSLILVLLLPSALALAACGGPSREEYAEDLNEICADLEEQAEDISAASPSNPQELSNQVDRTRKATQDALDRLRDLERPGGDDGETAEQYVETVEQNVNEQLLPALDELEQAVQERDEVKLRSAARRLQSIDDEEADRLAEDLGADECAEN